MENQKTRKLKNQKTKKLENQKTRKLKNWIIGKLDNWKTRELENQQRAGKLETWNINNELDQLTDLTDETDLDAKTWKMSILDHFGTFRTKFWTD